MLDFMVVGLKEFTSKSGNKCYIVEFLAPYVETQKLFGNVGYYVKTKFLDEQLFRKLNNDCIGRFITFKYDIDNFGRTTVVDIEIR